MRRALARFAAARACALAGAAQAQAPEVAWVAQTVHGLRFALAVESVLDPDASGDPRHAPAMEHRIVFAIRDAASAHSVQVSAVSLDVAERGYQGSLVPMRPVGSGDAMVHEARGRWRRRSSTGITIDFLEAADRLDVETLDLPIIGRGRLPHSMNARLARRMIEPGDTLWTG